MFTDEELKLLESSDKPGFIYLGQDIYYNIETGLPWVVEATKVLYKIKKIRKWHVYWNGQETPYRYAVWESFHGPTDRLITYINGDKKDFRINNLKKTKRARIKSQKKKTK